MKYNNIYYAIQDCGAASPSCPLTSHIMLLDRSATSTPFGPILNVTVRAPAATSRCASCCGDPGPTIDSASVSLGENMSTSCSRAVSCCVGGGQSQQV